MERTRIADMAEPPCGEALEGLPAARRPRAGADSQPRRADPRRADRRPRPEADHRDAAADQGARRRSHDRPEHAHPARGLADLPARRHHQQGPRRRRRHAGQPDARGCAARRRCTCRSTRRARERRDRRAAAACRASRASRVAIGATALVGYEVDSESGRDVRRELARTVVTNGWGLLELRPMRMSLEEIFLSLTTDESAQPAAPAEGETANA